MIKDNIMGRPKQHARKDFCLKCHRVFNSEGIHNRICPLCAEVNNKIVFGNSLMFLNREAVNDLINNQRGKLVGT